MNPVPELSVVVPTFNRADTLPDTVGALYASDLPVDRLEVLVVDDCSTDGTGDLLARLAAEHPTLRPVRTPVNGGPAAARNLGVREARGDCVYFTDDDCLVPPGLLSSFLDFLSRHPQVAGVGGGLVAREDNWVSRLERWKDRVLGIQSGAPRIGTDFPIGFTSNMMYRKSALLEAGLFDERFKAPAGEDIELKNRIATLHELAYLPLDVVHNHRYDLHYLLGIAVKQGLNRKPPRGRVARIALLAALAPLLVFNVLKKTLWYRGLHRT